MKKHLIGLLLATLTLLGWPTDGQAQTDIVTTTITEPVTSTASGVSLTVASATGISAGIWLLVDNDVMRVAQSYVSGTSIPVIRARRPTTHGDNAVVWVFPIGAIVTRPPQGSCTRGSGEAAYTLTLIDDGSGTIAACRLGVSVTGTTSWYVTDISGARGIPSSNPPETR